VDVVDVVSIRMPPTLAESKIHHDVRHLVRPQMNSGGATFFSRQERRNLFADNGADDGEVARMPGLLAGR
jgi:hypothetical protein